MYESFFGLSELPFSISPNPKYFYLSSHHREALAMLRHGILDSGGFVLFTGEVGTGKTVILRTLLRDMPQDIKTAVIYDPDLPLLQMLEKICTEFGISVPKENNKRILTDLISDFLLNTHKEGQRAVLLIDEAQLIPDDVIEQVRLLTNIETDNQKILQVILVGQPELQEKLRQPHMRQIAQRITARFHLLPLSLEEVDSYLRFRMQSAGCVDIIFSRAAVSELYHASNGIPRIINVVADKALLAAYVDNSHHVERKHMIRAIREVLGTKDLWNTVKDYFQNEHLKSHGLWLALFVAVAAVSGYALGHFNIETNPSNLKQRMVNELKADSDILDLKAQISELQNNQKQMANVNREQSRFAADILNNSFEESSWKNLAQEWGFTDLPDAIEESCREIASKGFRCLSGKLSLQELEHYNLPAVVQLMDRKLTPFYAVLLKLNESHAVIILNGREWIMPREWVENSFEGDFRLIWPLPAGENNIGPDSSIDALQLVVEMLDRYAPDENYTFNGWDENLSARISDFQKSVNLPVTGTAGLDTLWALLPYSDPAHTLYEQYILPKEEIQSTSNEEAIENAPSDTDQSESTEEKASEVDYSDVADSVYEDLEIEDEEPKEQPTNAQDSSLDNKVSSDSHESNVQDNRVEKDPNFGNSKQTTETNQKAGKVAVETKPQDKKQTTEAKSQPEKKVVETKPEDKKQATETKSQDKKKDTDAKNDSKKTEAQKDVENKASSRESLANDKKVNDSKSSEDKKKNSEPKEVTKKENKEVKTGADSASKTEDKKKVENDKISTSTTTPKEQKENNVETLNLEDLFNNNDQMSVDTMQILEQEILNPSSSSSKKNKKGLEKLQPVNNT